MYSSTFKTANLLVSSCFASFLVPLSLTGWLRCLLHRLIKITRGVLRLCSREAVEKLTPFSIFRVISTYPQLHSFSQGGSVRTFLHTIDLIEIDSFPALSVTHISTAIRPPLVRLCSLDTFRAVL